MTEPALRTLGPEDGPRLAALAEACPIEADFTLVFDRGPDFFRWPALVFDRWRYAGAEVDGRLVGACLAATRAGRGSAGFGPWFYLGDVRVHPEARGRGLVARMVDHLVDRAWDDVHEGFGIVKRGNRAGEGAAGLLCDHPRFEGSPVAALDVVLLPVLGGFGGERGVEVRPATAADAPAIAACLGEHGEGRRFAPVPEAAEVRRLFALPGLGPEAWRLAERGGRVVGALAAWDLDGVHGQRVLRYSPRAWPLRAGLGLLRRLRPGLAPLPEPGGRLRVLTTTHVAAGEPGVLRALLGAVVGGAVGRGIHLVAVPFVGEDPLRPAVRGLVHQSFPSTVFHSRRRGAGIAPAERPWVDLAWV